jgi:predicted DNA-binding transcriptional regulator AlpA
VRPTHSLGPLYCWQRNCCQRHSDARRKSINLSRRAGSGIVADLVTDPITRRIFDNVAVVIELDRHPLAGQWFTVADIATLLGVREATIRGWVSRGRFPRPDSHVGAVNVWRRETVEQWQAQRPRKGWQQRGPAAIVVPAALTVGTQVLDQLVSVIAS